MIKSYSIFAVAMAAAIAAPSFAAPRTAPAVPKPPVVTYGLIRDEYGVPLAADAKASARLVLDSAPDGRVYAQSAVEANVFLGMNYRLSLEIDSSGPVRSRAAVPCARYAYERSGGRYARGDGKRAWQN